jgi:hypothetical protein
MIHQRTWRVADTPADTSLIFSMGSKEKWEEMPEIYGCNHWLSEKPSDNKNLKIQLGLRKHHVFFVYCFLCYVRLPSDSCNFRDHRSLCPYDFN